MSEPQEGSIPPVRYLISWEKDTERRRLNLQHKALVQLFGGLLGPTIHLQTDDKVLDLACGTGIWGLSLAAESPSGVQIHGCDINTRDFPPPSSLSRNISFSAQSLLSLPRSWNETYDIVNQRLLVLALDLSEWRIDLAEIYRVMKPGGWIQLIELDYARSFAGLEAYVPATAELCGYMKQVFDANDLIWDIFGTIPRLIVQVGFTNLSTTTRKAMPAGGVAARVDVLNENGEAGECCTPADWQVWIQVNVFKAIKPKILQVCQLSEEKFDMLVDKMGTEWKDIPQTEEGAGCCWHRFCAQKPVSH